MKVNHQFVVQVSPVEVEQMICTMEQVADAAVIGLPDEDCGELPLAFVVKKADAKLSVGEVHFQLFILVYRI